MLSLHIIDSSRNVAKSLWCFFRAFFCLIAVLLCWFFTCCILNCKALLAWIWFKYSSACFLNISHVNSFHVHFFCQGILLKFAKKWKDEEKTPLQDRIRNSVRPEGSLKPRLDEANKRMQAQIRKLDTAGRHFSERDKSLFAKTVQAYSNHDAMRARVYANELGELRKTKKQIDNTKLALEQISIRLGTVSEFGDVVSMLSPAVSMLQDVGKGISTAMPEAGQELGNIGNLLSGIISETNQGSGMDIAFDSPTDAAQSILDEAAEMAEQNIKQQLPDIPTDIPVNIPKPPERVLTKT